MISMCRRRRWHPSEREDLLREVPVPGGHPVRRPGARRLRRAVVLRGAEPHVLRPVDAGSAAEARAGRPQGGRQELYHDPAHQHAERSPAGRSVCFRRSQGAVLLARRRHGRPRSSRGRARRAADGRRLIGLKARPPGWPAGAGTGVEGGSCTHEGWATTLSQLREFAQPEKPAVCPDGLPRITTAETTVVPVEPRLSQGRVPLFFSLNFVSFRADSVASRTPLMRCHNPQSWCRRAVMLV